ncbi:MAG: AAA family ATPase [Gemmatimonadota bacterium]
MKLTRVELSGFRGVRDRVSITVPSGFLVITGRNGAGKSSVLDAVEFSLVGHLRRQQGQSERSERIEDYLWWRGAGDPSDQYARCFFEGDDGRALVLRRDPSNSASGISPEVQDVLTETQSAPQGALEQLLVSAMVRDEEITRLSIDLAEAERFRFVREAIGERQLGTMLTRIEAARTVLSQRNDAAKSRYDRVRTQLNQDLERLSELRAAVVSEEQLATARAELTELLGAEIEDLNAVRTRGTDWGEAAAAAMALVRSLTSLIAERDAARAEAPTEAELVSAGKALETSVSKLRLELEGIEPMLRRAADAGGDEQLLAILLETGEHIGRQEGRCPLCGSVISPGQYAEHIHLSRAALRAEVARVAELRRRREQLLVAISDAEERRSKVERELAGQRSRREEITTQLNALQGRARQLVQGVADEWTPIEALQELRRFAQTREDDALRVGRLLRLLESASISRQVEAASARVEKTRSEADRLSREMERAEGALARATAIRASLRRLEGEVIEERLSAIGPLLEEIYLRLRPHSDWTQLKYHIRGDVKRFLSLQVGDGLNPKFMFSSGQRRAIGIAFLLSVYLSTGWSKLRTLFLDDPVQHIDDYRALHLVELLASIGRTSRQIVCTVEDPALAELLARRLRGVTPGPGAVVELEYIPGYGTRIASERHFGEEGEWMLLTA